MSCTISTSIGVSGCCPWGAVRPIYTSGWYIYIYTFTFVVYQDDTFTFIPLIYIYYTFNIHIRMIHVYIYIFNIHSISFNIHSIYIQYTHKDDTFIFIHLQQQIQGAIYTFKDYTLTPGHNLRFYSFFIATVSSSL